MTLKTLSKPRTLSKTNQMPTIFWNQGEKSLINGLDVLGYRQVDQDVEKAWVSGITTISIRARYLSLLTWIIAEYYQKVIPDGRNEGVLPDNENDLINLIRRLEFILLASTRQSDSNSCQTTVGLIGPEIFEDELNRLKSGETIELNFAKGGGSFGTYINVCRAFGLLAYANLPESSWAPKLTPRSKMLLQIRRELTQDSVMAKSILHGGSVDLQMIASEEHLFSAACLVKDECESECRLLETALLHVEANQDKKQYDRFRATVRIVLNAAKNGITSSSQIIADLYRDVVTSEFDESNQVGLAWASYELHRRIHFALELLLGAVTEVVIERDGATSEQIISGWASCDYPDALNKYIKNPKIEWEQSLSSFINTLKTDLFLSGSVNRSIGQKMPNAGSRAVFALALILSVWHQTKELRKTCPEIPGKAAGMYDAFPIIEDMLHATLSRFTIRLVDQCVVKSHISNTLRKIGFGADCSLRFFPDGRLLRPTGVTMGGGYSYDRLGNVIGFLMDLGFIANGPEGRLTTKGERLLKELEAEHA